LEEEDWNNHHSFLPLFFTNDQTSQNKQFLDSLVIQPHTHV
jgi:hypothetical protein